MRKGKVEIGPCVGDTYELRTKTNEGHLIREQGRRCLMGYVSVLHKSPTLQGNTMPHVIER